VDQFAEFFSGTWGAFLWWIIYNNRVGELNQVEILFDDFWVVSGFFFYDLMN
jgi:hypothetical protein